MEEEGFIDIIDVNKCKIICKVDPICSISEIISSCIKFKAIDDPEDAFLLNANGELCNFEKTGYESIAVPNIYLFLFSKSKIEFDFPVSKQDAEECASEIYTDWNRERFPFDDYNTNWLENIKKNEEKLFNLSDNAIRLYGNYAASENFIKISQVALNFRIRTSKSLLTSSKLYYEDAFSMFQSLLRLIKAFIDSYSSKYPRFLECLKKVNISVYQLSPSQLTSFASKVKKSLEALDYSLIKLKVKIFDPVLEDINNQELSAEKLESSINTAASAFDTCDSKDKTGEFLINFHICKLHKKFTERVHCLTIKEFCDKEAIVKKLTEEKMVVKIRRFEEQFLELDECLRKLGRHEKNIMARIQSINKYYKIYVNSAISGIYKLKYAKDKIKRIMEKFELLKENSKILDLPQELLSNRNQ